MKPTQQQIDEQLNIASEGVENGSEFPGMSYEEGVKAAIEWMLGYIPDAPMDN